MAEPQEALPPRLAWSVSALLLATGDVLAARFGAVTVRGELSGLSRPKRPLHFCSKESAGRTARYAALCFAAPRRCHFIPVDGSKSKCAADRVYESAASAVGRRIAAAPGRRPAVRRFLRRRARLESAGVSTPRASGRCRVPASLGIVTSLGAAACPTFDDAERGAARAWSSTLAGAGADAPAGLIAACGWPPHPDVYTLLWAGGLARGRGGLHTHACARVATSRRGLRRRPRDRHHAVRPRRDLLPRHRPRPPIWPHVARLALHPASPTPCSARWTALQTQAQPWTHGAAPGTARTRVSTSANCSLAARMRASARTRGTRRGRRAAAERLARARDGARSSDASAGRGRTSASGPRSLGAQRGYAWVKRWTCRPIVSVPARGRGRPSAVGPMSAPKPSSERAAPPA